MATESYRVSFNMANKEHIREYLMLEAMDIKTRNQFIHLAIGLLGNRIGYQLPEDGMMGVYASLTNNSMATVQNRQLPDIDMSKILEKKKKTTTPKNKKVDMTTINPVKDLPEETSGIGLAIQGSLFNFDEQS